MSLQLTLQAGGSVGLIATPVQGSMMPLAQTIVTHIPKEDDKMAPLPPPVSNQEL